MKRFDVEKAFEENRVCTLGFFVPQHNLVAYYMQCIVDEDFYKALAKAEKLTEFKKEFSEMVYKYLSKYLPEYRNFLADKLADEYGEEIKNKKKS